MDDDGDIWFAAKRYGLGSGIPVRWQGWALVAAHVALAVGSGLLLARLAPHLFTRHGALLMLIEAFILLLPMPLYAAHTRGGWKWRWGSED